MLYHVLGAISSLLFLLTWYGLVKQIIEIWQRKQQAVCATENLSVNQFGSSFFAFYANFIFGIAIEPFNHYLVWTRGGALLLLLVVLFAIFKDRQSRLTFTVLFLSASAFIAGLTAILFRPFPSFAQLGSSVIIVLVTLVLIQGTISQWRIIRKEGGCGALSFSLVSSTLVKDLSTVAFALTMPLHDAWPLILLNGSSVLFRGMLFLEMRKTQKA